MVRTSRPSHCAAKVRHDSTRFPSTSTVHAPHAPWSQPFLVPVRSRRSRSASSNVVRLSSRNGCAPPLTRSVTSTSVAARFIFDVELMYPELLGRGAHRVTQHEHVASSLGFGAADGGSVS